MRVGEAHVCSEGGAGGSCVLQGWCRRTSLCMCVCMCVCVWGGGRACVVRDVVVGDVEGPTSHSHVGHAWEGR